MSEMVIATKHGEPRYRLVPYGSGATLCYCIQIRKPAYKDEEGKEHEAKWLPSQRFPTTIAQGLRLIAEDIERNGDWRGFAKATPNSLREQGKVFEEYLNSFSLRTFT